LTVKALKNPNIPWVEFFQEHTLVVYRNTWLKIIDIFLSFYCNIVCKNI